MKTAYSISIYLAFLVVANTQAYADVTTSLPLQKMQTPKEAENDLVLQEKEKEKQKIELDNALTRARLEKELADLQAEMARLMTAREMRALKWEIEQEEQTQAHQMSIRALKQQKEQLETEVSIAQCKLDKEEQQFRAVTTKLNHDVNLLLAEVEQIKAAKNKCAAERQRADYVDVAPIYLKEPLQKDGSLVISDRRIEFNGVVTPWKANYVTDRIQYFNNKDANHPIFIVIGASPGGSVLAGFRILKAMGNSQAPVYVVVKELAASMAACITTLADRSYAYPNAIILQHQIASFFAVGDRVNVREYKEGQEYNQEMWRRTGGRVAKKMGISLKKFDALLYEKAAKGDWSEFGDNAQKLKWVDHIIDGIKDSSIWELPNLHDYTWKNDAKHTFEEASFEAATPEDSGVIYLPPLGAKDFYYLYNPDNRFQIRAVSK